MKGNFKYSGAERLSNELISQWLLTLSKGRTYTVCANESSLDDIYFTCRAFLLQIVQEAFYFLPKSDVTCIGGHFLLF